MGVWASIARAAAQNKQPDPILCTPDMEVNALPREAGRPKGEKFERPGFECHREDIRNGKNHITKIFKCLAPFCRKVITKKGELVCSDSCRGVAIKHYERLLSHIRAGRIERTNDQIRAACDLKQAPKLILRGFNA